MLWGNIVVIIKATDKDYNGDDTAEYIIDPLFYHRVAPSPPPMPISKPNISRDKSSNNDNNCSCFSHDGTGARIAYFMTLHNHRTLSDAVPLFRSIVSPSAIIIIHIDSKFSTSEYDNNSKLKNLVEHCSCGAKVLVASKFNCRWGSWTMNLPTLWGFKILTTDNRFINKWDVYINLSSDTLPVYTPQVMSQIFDPTPNSISTADTSTVTSQSLYGTNFVTSSSCITGLLPTDVRLFPPDWHKRNHYKHQFVIKYIDVHHDDGEKLDKVDTVHIHFGSQWMILNPQFVSYIHFSLERKDSLPSKFRDMLITEERLMTDETFLPSLLMHGMKWKNTLPLIREDGSLNNDHHTASTNIFHVRYERMDENYPNAFGDVNVNQRYNVPEKLSEKSTPSSESVDLPKAWGPHYLGVYDLGAIRESGALFIRKVTAKIDPNLAHLLPVDRKEQIPLISWPKELRLTHKPNWTKFEGMRYEMRQHKECVLSQAGVSDLSSIPIVADDIELISKRCYNK